MQDQKPLTGQAVLIGRTMLEPELAQALGVPVSTVKNLRYEQKIPFVQIGRGRPIYLVESIIGWLKSREIKVSDNDLSSDNGNIANDTLPATET